MQYTWESLTKRIVPTCAHDIYRGLMKCIQKKAFWMPEGEDLMDLAVDMWRKSGENSDTFIAAVDQTLREKRRMKHIFSCLQNSEDGDTKESYAVTNSPTPVLPNSEEQQVGPAQGAPLGITDPTEEGNPMPKYRKIDCRTQMDEKFREFSDDAKLLWYTILSHPSLTALGAMYCSLHSLAAELRWENERLSKAFQEPLQKGMVKYDEKALLIWLPNFIKYNPPENPNVLKAWVSSRDLLPECDLKHELMQYVAEYVKGLSEPFRRAFETLSKGFRVGMPNQEQEQEPKQEQKYPPLTPLILLRLWNDHKGKLPKVEMFTESELKKVRPLVNELNEVATESATDPQQKWIEFVMFLASTTHPTNYYFMLPSFFAKDSSKINNALAGAYSREFGKTHGEQASDTRRKHNRGSSEGRKIADGETADGKPSLTGGIRPKMRDLQ